MTDKKEQRATIRNIDPALIKAARIHGLTNDMTLGEVVNEAIKALVEGN